MQTNPCLPGLTRRRHCRLPLPRRPHAQCLHVRPCAGYKAAGPHPIHSAVLESMKRHAAAADAADKAADRERLRTLVANHGDTFSTSRCAFMLAWSLSDHFSIT